MIRHYCGVKSYWLWPLDALLIYAIFIFKNKRLMLKVNWFRLKTIKQQKTWYYLTKTSENQAYSTNNDYVQQG